MAVTVEERYGRRLSDTSGEILYLVRGTDNSITARSAVAGEAPGTLNSLPLQDIDVDEIKGLDAFTATARYARSGGGSQPATNDTLFAFDTTGGNEHITSSLSTASKYPGTAQDMYQAIGWDGQTVHGVDIPSAYFTFEVTMYLPKSSVTTAYKGVLYAATGKINHASFTVAGDGEPMTFAEGCCLFLGARGSARSSAEDYEISFRFAGNPAISGHSIGDITGIAKEGFQYLWVRFAPTPDSNKPMIPKPIAVYVENVYEKFNFSSLGLPTS